MRGFILGGIFGIVGPLLCLYLKIDCASLKGLTLIATPILAYNTGFLIGVIHDHN